MPPDNPLMEPAAKFYPNDPTASTEPAAPTDEPVTKPEDQDPAQGSESNTGKPEESDQVIKDDEEAETEESEGDSDDENVQVIELDGEEYDLNEVKAWREGNMRQADYTRKTQALAEDRKKWEAERETERASLTETQQKISEQSALLEVLVQEDEAVDWEDLKANEPEEYIARKEKADKRREALEKIKAEQSTPFDDPATIQAEQKKLIESDPDWLEEKDGKKIITKKFEQDMKLINDYAMKSGFSPEEFSQMTRAHYLTTILKAARFDELQKKAAEVKETRTKVPVVTKPKGKVKSSGQGKPIENIFYPNG